MSRNTTSGASLGSAPGLPLRCALRRLLRLRMSRQQPPQFQAGQAFVVDNQRFHATLGIRTVAAPAHRGSAVSGWRRRRKGCATVRGRWRDPTGWLRARLPRVARVLDLHHQRAGLQNGAMSRLPPAGSLAIHVQRVLHQRLQEHGRDGNPASFRSMSICTAGDLRTEPIPTPGSRPPLHLGFERHGVHQSRCRL